MKIPVYHGGSANKKYWSGQGGSIPISSSFYVTIPFHNVNTFTGDRSENFIPVLNGLLPGNEIGTLFNYPGKEVYFCGGFLMAASVYLPEGEIPNIFSFSIHGHDYVAGKGIVRDSVLGYFWDFEIYDLFQISIDNVGIKYYVPFSLSLITPLLVAKNQFHLVIFYGSPLHSPTGAYVQGVSGYLLFNIITPLP